MLGEQTSSQYHRGNWDGVERTKGAHAKLRGRSRIAESSEATQKIGIARECVNFITRSMMLTVSQPTAPHRDGVYPLRAHNHISTSLSPFHQKLTSVHASGKLKAIFFVSSTI